ncbi:MAG: hypothetical protein HQM13_23030 [SAR324 cluster bacterium]|nr:hypothetical protein [SAR324 cluster bacterium]
MNLTTENGNSNQIFFDAFHLFLKDPAYADHRKLAAAMITVFILIGMLFFG